MSNFKTFQFDTFKFKTYIELIETLHLKSVELNRIHEEQLGQISKESNTKTNELKTKYPDFFMMPQNLVEQGLLRRLIH